MTIHELAEQRAKLVADMRGLLDKAEKENRDLTAEEVGQYERMEADVEAADEEISLKQEADARKSRLAEYESRQTEIRNPAPKPRLDTGEVPQFSFRDELSQAISNRSYGSLLESLAKNPEAVARDREMAQYIRTGAVGPYLREYAALQMDSDTAGGSLIAAEMFATRFIQGLDQQVFMRQISTVIPVMGAHSLGIAAEGADPADSDWTVELATGTLDTTMTTGKRMLRPRDLAKRILVSDKLLRHNPSAEAYVRQRLTFVHGITQEQAFLTGNGAGRPLGVFTASADGISTGQDMSTDNTTTNFTADGLINAKYNLAAQYLSSANLRWIMHRTAVRNARKLKTGDGQYIWQPGLGGQPNTLLDTPLIMSEYAPSTFTTGLYVGIIGDFSYYYIADGMSPTFRRLDELHYATNQIGFYLRSEHDGMPVLEEAFTRVTLA